MNGRVHHDETPEERIAAVAKSLMIQMEDRYRKSGSVGPKGPDYADFRDVLRPFIQRELLNARIDEARRVGGKVITDRVRELAEELTKIQFPNEYQLRP